MESKENKEILQKKQKKKLVRVPNEKMTNIDGLIGMHLESEPIFLTIGTHLESGPT